MKDKDFNPEEIALPPELAARQWLTYEEFGSLAGVSASAIRSWEKQKIVQVRKFTPRCKRIHVSEVDRLKRGELMESADPIPR